MKVAKNRPFVACVTLAGFCLFAGAAIAVEPAQVRVDFDAKHITHIAVKGEAGVAGRPVTADDPVRVASISKLIVALTTLRLVDEGKVDLDRPIESYLGYPVRNPAFPEQPLTLRQLLSHKSSLTDGADYLLPLDADLGAFLKNPQAWDSAHKPGSWYHYTNLNFPVIAAILEAATGERFDRLAASRVLAPLKLDACFNWQTGCSAGRRGQAVTLLRPNGDLAKDAPVQGTDPCPFVPASDGSCDLASYRLGHNGAAFSPQGGLRISARDLAKIGQLLLRKGRPILSKRAFAEMTRTEWQAREQPAEGEVVSGSYGLGLMMVADDAGQTWLGHSGSAYSLRSGLWVNAKTGQGRVRYVTMVAENAPDGDCLVTCP